MPRPTHALRVMLLVLAAATCAVSCSRDEARPPRDRAALVALARGADPTLDDGRAGCVVDGLTARFGPERSAAILVSAPGATLPPAEADAVVTVALGCSGAPDVTLPGGTSPGGTSPGGTSPGGTSPGGSATASSR